ncbi:hypothetical protein Cni_G16569 [Canna indica]|uniref:Methyltransferase n=1 Tax=Canna indica TaxID=4628 RepID=A0AAQ3KHY1_9LILI|nr:hypothetical protein Cni_G16569 [Canna indica]
MREFSTCDIKYSEYTPCEDRDRSVLFKCDRLIYQKQHCPKRGELLRCLILAPTGYKTMFPWPTSWDAAWFVNVPHKEPMVENAVQKWIRVEDKF